MARDDLAARIEGIAEQARADYGVPPALALTARRATLERFVREPEHVHARRLEAYFWAVVRRRALRGGSENADLRRRFLLAAGV